MSLPAAGRLLSSPGLGVRAPEPGRGMVFRTAQRLATWRGDGLQKALDPRAA